MPRIASHYLHLCVASFGKRPIPDTCDLHSERGSACSYSRGFTTDSQPVGDMLRDLSRTWQRTETIGELIPFGEPYCCPQSLRKKSDDVGRV